MIRQTRRNPALPLRIGAISLLTAAGLLLMLLTSSSAAAMTDRQANARSLAKAAMILRREHRLRHSHRDSAAKAGPSGTKTGPSSTKAGPSSTKAGHSSRHRLAAIAQHTDALGSGEACEGEGLAPEAGNLEEVRAATLCLVNRQRLIHGEHALLPNARLEHAAQGHTLSMVDEDYFSHYNPNGETPAERMKQSGYIYSSEIGYEIGENIAWGTLSLATPKAIVESWMQSPGHRENILDSRYRETAIGVLPEAPEAFAEGEQGAIYTQDFGVIIVN